MKHRKIGFFFLDVYIRSFLATMTSTPIMFIFGYAMKKRFSGGLVYNGVSFWEALLEAMSMSELYWKALFVSLFIPFIGAIIGTFFYAWYSGFSYRRR